jgi:phage gpG-like protein
MSVTLRLEGTEALARALRKLDEDARKEVKKAVDATGLSLRGTVVKKYQRGPATGETYEKYNPRRTHTASAPGEAPATDTGRLANSVTIEDTGPLTIEVGTEVEYGPYLEFGTRTIAPRPNWVPSVQEEEPKYVRRVEAAIRRAAR